MKPLDNTEYNATSIEVLEGLEAVRKRPGMYIGNTHTQGLHHLIWEILDNSVDEYLAGVCTDIRFTLGKDNSITIADNGRGIPVELHTKMGIPTLRVVMTILHAGGKFGGNGYTYAGGLHGVGASVVNALSEFLEVTVKRNGGIYRDRYEQGGKPVGKLNKKGELPKIGDTEEHGTSVTFKPDVTIFETTEWDVDVIKTHLREKTFLNKDLRIHFRDEKT